MDAIEGSPEEVFLTEKLNIYGNIETSLKKLKRRLTSDVQYNNSGDAQKLIDSLKEYSAIVSNIPAMKEIGECVDRVASAHNLFEEMINKIHEILRYQVAPAVQQSIREFKQCREQRGRLQQCRNDYENISRAQTNKGDSKDKEKWKNAAIETKKRWESIAEETMTLVRNAQSTHNVSMSGSMTTLIQSYRASFIAGQEYMESIQPNINSFITYAEDRQTERKRAEHLNRKREDVTDSKHGEAPRTPRRTGLGRLIAKSKRAKSHNDEDEDSDPEEKDVLEENDSISFDCDPKTNEQEVRAADVPHLVRHLTHPSHLDIPFRDAFFLTFRLFTNSLKVCSLLEENYYATFENEKKIRVLAAFKYWTENYPFDFVENKELRDQFRQFLSTHVSKENPSVEAQLQATLDKLIQQNQTSSRLRNRIQNKLKISCLPDHQQQALSLSFENLDPIVIAEQLTVRENRFFCSINPMELLSKNWSKKEKAILAPNILAMTENFNRTSRWVVNEIISNYQLKTRVETLKKFINILQHLRSLNNFSGVMEVLAGVNSSPVRRLKSTWKELTESELRIVQDIERLMNHKSSYRSYRSTLHSAKIPVVPFIGIYLTDLTFTEDGNPSYLDNLVNFSKCHKIARVVEEIIGYQVLYQNIQPDPVIQSWLMNVKPIGEEEAYSLSTRIEPRDPSEAFENLLLEEDRLRKQVEELQVRVDDLKNMQERQTTTVCVLSDQLRDQKKLVQKQKKLLEQHVIHENKRMSTTEVDIRDLSEAEQFELKMQQNLDQGIHIDFVRKPGSGPLIEDMTNIGSKSSSLSPTKKTEEIKQSEAHNKSNTIVASIKSDSTNKVTKRSLAPLKVVTKSNTPKIQKKKELNRPRGRKAAPPPPKPKPKPKVIGVGKAVAIFDFVAENADELSFSKGDSIVILSTDESVGGEGWWVGMKGKEQGVFPSDYVRDYSPHKETK